MMDGSEGITKGLARAQFTEEMLAEMRALIGTQLRTEACLNNEYATRLAIQRFCEGIGDVVRLGGRVEAKKVDADGDHVVRLKTWA